MEINPCRTLLLRHPTREFSVWECLALQSSLFSASSLKRTSLAEVMRTVENWATNVIFGYYVCMQPRIRWLLSKKVLFCPSGIEFLARSPFFLLGTSPQRWSFGIRLVLSPVCGPSPGFHFLFASTVIINPFNVEQDLANCTGFSRTLLILFIDRNHHIMPDFGLIISSFGGLSPLFASFKFILRSR